MASGITTLRIVSHCPVLGRVIVQHRIVWKSPIVPAPVVVIIELLQELTPAFVFKVKTKRLCVKSLFFKALIDPILHGRRSGDGSYHGIYAWVGNGKGSGQSRRWRAGRLCDDFSNNPSHGERSPVGASLSIGMRYIAMAGDRFRPDGERDAISLEAKRAATGAVSPRRRGRLRDGFNFDKGAFSQKAPLQALLSAPSAS